MAVWMDRDEAKIFHVEGDTFDEAKVQAPAQHVRRHAQGQHTKAHNHPDDEHRFFKEVAHALAGDAAVLVLGPSVTKMHFLTYAHKHDPSLQARIVGVESADHPSDRQLVAHVRAYFLNAPAASAP